MYDEQIENYSAKDTAGVTIAANYPISIPGQAGQQTVYWNGTTPNLSGTYKFIIIKSNQPAIINDIFVEISVYSDTTLLNKGDYMLYIQENSSAFVKGSTIPNTSVYTTGWSGWKNGLGRINGGWTALIQNSNDAGCWSINELKHQLYDTSSHDNYYRIGLKQNATDKFNKITIQYYDVSLTSTTPVGSLQTYNYKL